MRLFKKEADFLAFEQVIAEAFARVPLRILGYTVMGNHWHFVVWPKQGQAEQVSEFFRWLTVTHSQRWHAHHGTAGMGRVDQGLPRENGRTYGIDYVSYYGVSGTH